MPVASHSVKTSAVAVFDIGSNSVKVLVARRRANKSGWSILLERTRVTGLAQGLLRAGKLDADAMARTLAALTELRREAHRLVRTRWGSKAGMHVLAAATSAVRDSSNRKDFVRRARAAIGGPIRILSGEEEAQTVFAAHACDARWRGRPLLVVDVGGGSTEWIVGRGGKLSASHSLPLGVVRLRERFEVRHPLGVEKFEKMRALLAAQLRGNLRVTTPREKFHLLFTGGTGSILAAMLEKKAGPQSRGIEGARITRAAVERLSRRLALLPLEKLERVRGLPPDRANVILPGAALILATFDWLGASSARVSGHGLRHGLLQQHADV